MMPSVHNGEYLKQIARMLYQSRLTLDQAYDSRDKQQVDAASYQVGEDERYLIRCAIRFAAAESGAGLPVHDRFDVIPDAKPQSPGRE